VYRFLLGRRWLAAAAVVLLLVPACVRFGFWQLDRYEQRRERSALIRANLAASPRPVAELAPVGGAVRPEHAWRPVQAVGAYDVSRQLVVRHRSYAGRPGFQVLTPLLTAQGVGVLVNRGWVPVARSDGSMTSEVPAPPTGEVKVLGRLRPSEGQPARGPRDGPGVPAGQVIRIDVPRIAGALPYPVHAGYVELVAEQPQAATAPRPLDPPQPSTGPHLAYAVQWWLFGLIVVIGSVVLVRREAAERAASRRAAAGKATGEGAGGEATGARTTGGATTGGGTASGTPDRATAGPASAE
jgi:cytochrome oxidase assembly protein ShyY1